MGDDMSEKKHCVEVYFDDEELAILEELSAGTKWSIEKLVYDSVFRAHFTEEAKKRQAAISWILSQEPFDLEADWKRMKDWLEKDWAWKLERSYDQYQESPQ